MTVVEQRRAQLEEELKRIVTQLIEQACPKRIILFGSLAAGQVKEWSDIDLAVVMETDRRIYERIGFLLKLCDPQVAVEFIVYTPREFEELGQNEPFVQEEIIAKGRVLYEAA